MKSCQIQKEAGIKPVQGQRAIGSSFRKIKVLGKLKKTNIAFSSLRIITRKWGCFGESLSLKSYWLSDRFLPSFVKDVAAILKAYFLTHLQSLLQTLLGNNSLESECQRGWQADLESEKKHPAVSHLLCVFSTCSKSLSN